MKTFRIAAVAVAAAVSAVSFQASAGAPALADEIGKCRALEAAGDRLACYDAIAVSDVAGGAEAAKKAPDTKSKVADFGAERVTTPEEESREELDAITAGVTKVVWSPRKQFAVYLDNGQIWVQKDDERVRFPDGEFTVEIKKGALGTYNMIIPGRTALVKVTRYK